MSHLLKTTLAIRQLKIRQLSVPSQRFNFAASFRHNFLSTRSSKAMSSTKTVEKASDIEYKWINGVEPLERYRPGGYHPIMIGDMLHGQYHIVDKLGFGGYSTIWLARNTQLDRYIVVKAGVANSRPYETKILRELSAPASSLSSKGCDLIPIPLDVFDIEGPNGIHPCYTMIPAQCNLREASYSCLFPIDTARSISAALVLAVAFIHSRGYVHGGLS